jgi:Asp-tRNA(Asn)/Glu-tRNA(Gln) amidotransferase A subunit family amidase
VDVWWREAQEGGIMSQDMTELLTRPALELAALIRSGQIRARELVEAALHEAEARTDINAFALVDADAALAVADTISPGDPDRSPACPPRSRS